MVMASAIVAVSIGIYLLTFDIPDIRTADALGPAAFPRTLVVFMGVGALIIGGRRTLGSSSNTNQEAPEEESQQRQGVQWQEIAMAAIAIIYVVALPFVGYVPATFLTIFAGLRVVGMRGWRGSFLLPLVLTAGLYFFFGRVLKIHLP